MKIHEKRESFVPWNFCCLRYTCKKCGSLHDFKNCFETIGSTTHPKICMHVPFRHLSRRGPCGSKLIKEVITKYGKKFYPLKTYCYYSLLKSMPKILERNNMLDQCENWQTLKIPTDFNYCKKPNGGCL